MKKKYSIIITTVTNTDEGETIARNLLEKKCVACVSIVPGITSLYWWNGTIESSTESLLLMKTVDSYADKTIEYIKTVHSYDIPEIIVVPIDKGLPKYLEWIEQSVSSGKRES